LETVSLQAVSSFLHPNSKPAKTRQNTLNHGATGTQLVRRHRLASVADAADYLHHRRGIEQLVALAVAQLSDVQQDRIRDAVAARRNTEKARAFIDGTLAEGLGIRFLAAFAAADTELQPAQVDELESLIDARLAHPT